MKTFSRVVLAKIYLSFSSLLPHHLLLLLLSLRCFSSFSLMIVNQFIFADYYLPLASLRFVAIVVAVLVLPLHL